MKVSVTQSDNDEGVRHDPYNCMFATALCRQIQGATRPRVTKDDIRYTRGDGVRVKHRSTPEVVQYIERFERGLPFEAFTTDLGEAIIVPRYKPRARRIVDKPTPTNRRISARVFGEVASVPATTLEHIARKQTLPCSDELPGAHKSLTTKENR